MTCVNKCGESGPQAAVREAAEGETEREAEEGCPLDKLDKQSTRDRGRRSSQWQIRIRSDRGVAAGRTFLFSI